MPRAPVHDLPSTILALPTADGPGADSVFGGQDSELLLGGSGDDLLVGDIPNKGSDTGLPPTVDPSAHRDTCVGGTGTETSVLCEVNVGVQSIT